MNVEDKLDDERILKRKKNYSHLMLYQIDVQNTDDEQNTTKGNMWQQTTYKKFFEEIDHIHGQLE